MTTQYETVFGSLEKYEKGRVEVINDNAKNYAFSNVFEICNTARPWERVVFGMNQIYVLEAMRAEGKSPWFSCAHDEFALCMDGEVEIHLKARRRANRARSRAQRRGAREGRSARTEDGLDEDPPRPPGHAAEEQRLSIPRRQAIGARAADLQGRFERRALGRDLPVVLTSRLTQSPTTSFTAFEKEHSHERTR